MLTDRQMIERMAAGNFTVTVHAIESFRVRVANLAKGRVIMTVRRQLIEIARENGQSALDFPGVEGKSWIIKVVHPRYKYKFWAVICQDWLEEDLLIVKTLYRPGNARGMVSMKTHYDALDELHRKLLRVEDKYYETFDRLFRKEKGSGKANGSVVHCECCIHNLLSDEAADNPEPHGPGGPGDGGPGSEAQ